MKSVKIIRNENVNGKKMFLGEKSFDMPEDVFEAIKVHGEKEVYDAWYASRVITLRATIGNKESKTAVLKDQHEKIIQKARELKANGDSTMYDNLVSLEIIRD